MAQSPPKSPPKSPTKSSPFRMKRTLQKKTTVHQFDPNLVNIEVDFDNSDEINSLFSDLSSGHSDQIEVSFEGDLDEDNHQLEQYLMESIKEKNSKRKTTPYEVSEITENFIDDIIKKISDFHPLDSNKVTQRNEQNVSLSTKLKTAKSPTISADDQAQTLKKELKGVAYSVKDEGNQEEEGSKGKEPEEPKKVSPDKGNLINSDSSL